MTRQFKFYQTLNQPARNARHGKHRPARTSPHRDSTDRTGHGSGGTVTFSNSLWPTPGAGDDTSQDAGEDSGLTQQGLFYPGNGVSIGWGFGRKPQPIENVVTTGELTGHRIWYVHRRRDPAWGDDVSRLMLSSIAHTHYWRPHVVETGKVDDLVTRNNSAVYWLSVLGGVYSFKSDALMQEEWAEMQQALRDLNTVDLQLIRNSSYVDHPMVEAVAAVCGTIKLWGQVVEHERGYRAEFARIVSLDAIYALGYDDGWSTQALHELKQRYEP